MWQECKADAWVHLAFLSLAVSHLEVAAKAGVKRFIGFSSTSVFTKKVSGSSKERQPVHAEDLALACIAVLENDRTLNKAYILSGGEVIAYRDMVARIFGTLNRKPRIFNIHPVIYKCAVVVVKHILPRYAFVQA